MDAIAVVGLVAAVLGFIALMEMMAAAVPMLIVIVLVSPEERPALAACLAAADSRRLRLWPALRAAATARRRRPGLAGAGQGRSRW